MKIPKAILDAGLTFLEGDDQAHVSPKEKEKIAKIKKENEDKKSRTEAEPGDKMKLGTFSDAPHCAPWEAAELLERQKFLDGKRGRYLSRDRDA